MRGSEQIAATVDLTKVTKPNGITVTKDTDAISPTLTISASTSFTTAGVVRIPVVVDGDITINKDFSVAIAFTGQTGGKGDPGDAGKGVASVAIDYQASASNTTAPTGTWSATPPSVDAGAYLWTRMIFTYTDSTSSDPVYSVAKQGATGETGAGAQWYTGTGITGTSTTATIFSGSGVADAKIGDMYLNTSTYNTIQVYRPRSACCRQMDLCEQHQGSTRRSRGCGHHHECDQLQRDDLQKQLRGDRADRPCLPRGRGGYRRRAPGTGNNQVVQGRFLNCCRNRADADHLRRRRDQ